MGSDSNRIYTKRGILDGAERWAQLLRDFLASGHEVAPLRMEDFGGGDPQGLADALAFSALAAGLSEEVQVIPQDGQVLLVRSGAMERARDAASTEEDGPAYDWLVGVLLRRGFTSLGCDLEPGEDPEAVKRALEEAVERHGEQGRITVKVDSPVKVSLRLKGGHKLPRVVPKKLGLSHWVDSIEEFVFQDEPVEEQRIEPRGSTLDDALAGTMAAVKAMELDDFLAVDTVGASVRVRYARDATVEESVPDKAAGVEELFGQLVQRALDGEHPETLVNTELLAEFIASNTRDGSSWMAMAEATLGIPDVMAKMFTTVIERKGLSGRLDVSVESNGIVLAKRDLAAQPTWAERTIDRFFSAIDESGEHGMTITLKDDTYRAEDLARELEDEVRRRGFLNAIEVDHSDREVNLVYYQGNLHVLMADNLDSLEAEEKLVRGFLTGAESSLTVPAGISRTETARRMLMVAAAATQLGVMNELSLRCGDTDITLARK